DELAGIPILAGLDGAVVGDDVPDHLGEPLLLDLGREVLPLEDGAALLVDDHPLHVHDVVVLEDVLALDEVLLLDLLLRVLDLVRQDLLVHRLVVGQLEPLHDVVEPVTREQADEVVLAGQVEARLARVALAARAAAELVVDPARLVALGAEDVEAAELAHGVVDLDVDAAAGHVGRDRDRGDLPRVLDDLGLARVLLRVQDVVLDALTLEELAQELRCLNGDRADEHRLAPRVAVLDVVDDGLELRLHRLEDQVVLVLADDRDVGWDRDDLEAIDLDELLLLGLRRAGHARELVVEAEIILERDRRERLVLILNLDALLRLDRLVEALRPTAALHEPAPGL